MPSWQSGKTIKNYATGAVTALTGRGVPDVAFNADPNTGITFYYYYTNNNVSPPVVYPNLRYTGGGGTSSAAPHWAGLVARLNEQTGLSQGFLNDKFYAHPEVFNDITVGDNNEGGVGYSATSGWDACTGLGTPDGKAILAILPTKYRTSANWDKTSRTQSPNSHWLNWGLLRSALGNPVADWGSDGSKKKIPATVTQTLFGRNVDVVVIDYGMPDPGHPEFAVSADGTGGSRMQQLDWFQYPNSIGISPIGSYAYPASGNSYYNSNGQSSSNNSNHAAAVASIVAGNTLGWATQSNIYAIDITRMSNWSPSDFSSQKLAMAQAFQYAQEFHTSKTNNGITTPTIIISSTLLDYKEYLPSSITSVTYRGNTFVPADLGGTEFTAEQLRYAGIMQPYINTPASSGGAPYANYFYLPLRSDDVDTAVTGCINAGVIVVSIANNFSTYIDVPGGQDYDNCVVDSNNNTLYYMRGSSPGATPGVICVGAIDSTVTEQMATYSSRGPRVDIFAPGSDVMLAFNGAAGDFSASLYATPPVVQDYRNSSFYLGKGSGTSNAGPQVAGYLACLLEQYPTAGQTTALSYLTSNAKSGQLTSPAWDINGTLPLPYLVDNNLQGSPNRTLFAQGVATAQVLSLDATLSGLTISSGSLSYTGATSYNVSVANGISSVTVTPTATQVGSTITVNGTPVSSGSSSGAINLSVGSNTITINVTALDNITTQQYTITVTRASPAVSNDATLSSLTISSGILTPAFSGSTIEYTASVTAGTSSVTVTPTHNQANATITVNGTTVTSGSASGSISLSVGNNSIVVVVTAQDGTTKKNYTITVTRGSATLPTLSSLTISSGTLSPSFSSGTTSYTDAVTNDITSVTVTPTQGEVGDTITVNGTTVTSGSPSSAINLDVGPNSILVVVTASDSTTNNYTISVVRAAPALSNDSTLASLSISSGTLDPVFDSPTLNYAVSVDNTVSSVTLTPTANQTDATITVNGASVLSGTASQSINLTAGVATPISILVTAPDGTTFDTYIVTVTRALPGVSSDATLSALSVSGAVLTPTFSSNTISYSSIVTNSITSVTVTPTRNQADATIKVNGTTVASGSASGSISLSVGSNTIEVVVTAQDGTTTKKYTITILRSAPVASNDATLSDLSLSIGNLTPDFSRTIYSYTSEVVKEVGSITVTPVIHQPNATVKVNGKSVVSGQASDSIDLSYGDNTISVLVTAQNGTTTKNYSIVVTRDTPVLVEVVSGDIVGHNDFDSIYLAMYSILGRSTSGYGVIPLSSSVPAGYTNYAQNWIDLYDDIQQCYIHQKGVPSTSITAVSTGTLIQSSYGNALKSVVEELAVNPVAVDSSQLSTTNANTIYSSGDTWTTKFTYSVVYNWATSNQVNYFLNLGGSIAPRFTATGADLSGWTSIIDQLNGFAYNQAVFLNNPNNPVILTLTNGSNSIVVTATLSGSRLTVLIEFNTTGTATLTINGSLLTTYSNGFTGGVQSPIPQAQMAVGGNLSPVPIPVFNFPINGSKTQTMTLSNNSGSPVTVSGISLIGYAYGTVTPSSFTSIPTGQTAQFDITYSGSVADIYSGQLIINSNIGNAVFDTTIIVGNSVTLTPSSVAPITLTVLQPQTYSFSVATVGNNISTYTVGLSNTVGFSVSSENAINLTQPFTVTFDPAGLANSPHSTVVTVNVGGTVATVEISITLNVPVNTHLGNWISALAFYNSVIGLSYDLINGTKYVTVGVGAYPSLDTSADATVPPSISELAGNTYPSWAEVYRVPLTGAASTYYPGNYTPVRNGNFYGLDNTIGSNFGSGDTQGSICIITDDGNGNLSISMNVLTYVAYKNIYADFTLEGLTYSFYYYDEFSNRYTQLADGPINGYQTNYFTGFNAGGGQETSLVNANLQNSSVNDSGGGDR